MRLKTSVLTAAKLDMTPMIDVVFQLMIFFMLSLKIVTSEGNFDVNMPLAGDPGPSTEQPVIKVRLVAEADGQLERLMLGQRNRGTGPRAFAALNSEILKLIGRPGNPLTQDLEVEIDADYRLQYAHTLSAISACTGRLDPHSGQIIRYVEKIRFAAPRPAA